SSPVSAAVVLDLDLQAITPLPELPLLVSATELMIELERQINGVAGAIVQREPIVHLGGVTIAVHLGVARGTLRLRDVATHPHIRAERGSLGELVIGPQVDVARPTGPVTPAILLQEGH